MDQALAEQILQQLRDGQLHEYTVTKEAFPVFREVLVVQEDVKSFRGNAQHKGNVLYTYEPGWTA